MSKGRAEFRIKRNTPTLSDVVMGTIYEQLSAEERPAIMLMTQEGKSLRAMARTLHRNPSTISREWSRQYGEHSCALDPRPVLSASPTSAPISRHYTNNLPPSSRLVVVQGVLNSYVTFLVFLLLS